MADSIFKQCLDAVKSEIDDLSLDGVRTNDVRVLWLPWDQYEFRLGLTVHPAKRPLLYGRGTVAHDDVGYGCQATMVEANSSDKTKNLNRHTQWQESIRKHFNCQRLSGVASVWKCTIETTDETGPIPVPSAFVKQNHLVHALIVRCWSRETRG